MIQRARVFCLALACSASSAFAVDGVFEISAVCAQFGCFDGDTSGLPVQITQPGSYRLTGNLSTASVNQGLIAVSTDGVSIDLNGYSLIGPVTCSGNTLTCSSSGSGDGIQAINQTDIQVRNGSIRGMGGVGVVVGGGALIEQLTVSENGSGGIEAQAPGAVLRRLAVRENGGRGVALGFGSSYLMDSVIFNNGAQGVFGGFCGNILAIGNTNGNACVAIAPNRCSVATDCD